MNISFQINCQNLSEFIERWSPKYKYPNPSQYDDNIGKPLTEQSIRELFEWKNGFKISLKKIESIKNNYPLIFKGNREDLENRYLNHEESGGAIWNIFYLHCRDHNAWPIYDQHTFRAMKYMQTGQVIEIGDTNKQKYESYKTEYIPFIESFGDVDRRGLDKALFAFGRFLKAAGKYV